MNLALVTSYIIAAMLMLSIVMMNLRMSSSSSELTLTQITRQHVSDVADMLNDDIPNMGFNCNEPTSENGDLGGMILTQAETEKIQFYRKLDASECDDESIESHYPQLITWELLEEDPDFTPENDSHRTLLRIEQDTDENGEIVAGSERVTKIRTGVTRFTLRYFDEYGKSTDPDDNEHLTFPVSLSSVKQIYLELEMQSAAQIHTRANSGGRYIRSVYEKRFSPRNLDL
ncbi:MAG: hypothetical protein WEC12_03840 [Balneolaceae bacterium]